MRHLEYRRCYGGEPGNFFRPSIAKCESPAPACVANGTIQHTCYPGYAAYVWWGIRVNFHYPVLLSSLGLGPEPCTFPPKYLSLDPGKFKEGLLGYSTGSVTFGGSTLNFQLLPNRKWPTFL
jgi:hypothetical protein